MERRSPVNGVAQDSYCESFMNSILGAALANLYLFIWISTDLVQVLKRDTLYLTLYLLFESGIPDPLIESTVICGIRYSVDWETVYLIRIYPIMVFDVLLQKKKSVGA